MKALAVMGPSINWDDWRIVEAIASTGATGRAAKVLNMNQSTVFRRVAQLEHDLGVRLFDRDKRGFRLTAQGEEVLPEIRQLHRLTTDIERRIGGLDKKPIGEVRLSVNQTVARYLLVEKLDRFLGQYPDIVVHLDVNDRLVSVRDREADLVIRGSNDPDPDLYGRKLMRLSYAIYAGTKWATPSLRRRARAKDFASLDLILWKGELLKTSPGSWMRSVYAKSDARVTATEVESTAYLAAAGRGCALLPRFLGDRQQSLTRISDNIPGLYTELWALTHEDLRKTARVSTLLKFLGTEVGQANELPSATTG